MTLSDSIILISGSLGFILLVLFVLFTSSLDLEYSEYAAEVTPATEVEPVA